ncbi:MAG: hypothetical protein Q9225_001321 [Loekoesia sp. 1 TL-2023]
MSGLNRKSGLKAKVLILRWPPGVIPSELPNFETEARRKRYQALGRACYNANIPSLLLGHHEADEKETLIMRLIEGYRGEGLRGISEEADIPECWGIYGVQKSGGRDYTVTWEETQMVKARDAEDMQEVLPPLNEYRAPGFEYGGVRIYRPLIDYKKAALQATLEEAGVPWVTDSSNYDPTLSIRNAIRYLLHQGLLPKALAGDPQDNSSVLRAAAENIRRRYLRRNEQANELFQACDIISFDAQSGRLEIRIPLSTAPPGDPDFYTQSKFQQETEVQHIAARVTRLLLNIVAPGDHLSLQKLEHATKTMFWHLQKHTYSPGREKDENLEPTESTFTAGGVLCKRVKSATREMPLPGTQSFLLDPDHIWYLSRNPFVNTQPEPTCTAPPTQRLKQNKGKKRDEERDEGRNKGMDEFIFGEPPWQLWDGRYWIQVLNPTDKPFRICPLSKDRLSRCKAKLRAGGAKRSLDKLEKTLKPIRPPRVRHTLPAIVDDEDNVLALPTLGLKIGIPRAKALGIKAEAPRWRVRYKKVVFPDHVKSERIVGLKEEKLEGVKPALARVEEEAEWEKPKVQKEREEMDRKREKLKALKEILKRKKEKLKKKPEQGKGKGDTRALAEDVDRLVSRIALMTKGLKKLREKKGSGGGEKQADGVRNEPSMTSADVSEKEI